MEDEYKIRGIVNSSEVPNWARRPKKWANIAEGLLDLKCGETLMVEFPDHEAANAARNTIRDTFNVENQDYLLRTRVVRNPDDSTCLFLTKLHSLKDKENPE